MSDCFTCCGLAGEKDFFMSVWVCVGNLFVWISVFVYYISICLCVYVFVCFVCLYVCIYLFTFKCVCIWFSCVPQKLKYIKTWSSIKNVKKNNSEKMGDNSSRSSCCDVNNPSADDYQARMILISYIFFYIHPRITPWCKCTYTVGECSVSVYYPRR